MAAAARVLICAVMVAFGSAAAQTPRAGSVHSAPAKLPSIALHYGSEPPLAYLRAFDIVVVDPDSNSDPLSYRKRSGAASELFAYISIGELQPSRSWAKAVPESLLIGRNQTWGSSIIDVSQPAWREFFVDKIVAPLWDKGYRGFFIDTIDSYQIAVRDDAAAAARMRSGLVQTIRAVRTRFPDARLILNRGFELLSQLDGEIFAVAAESLYRSWQQSEKRYTEVSNEDRSWLLARFAEARQQHGVHTLAIDYVDPADRETMRRTVRRIAAHGVIPYVTDGDLRRIGMGRFEVRPRRVLVVFDGVAGQDPHLSPAQRYLAAMLHYLGFRVELYDVNARGVLPDLKRDISNDQYAAIVTWFESGELDPKLGLPAWLLGIIESRMRLVMLSRLGFVPDAKALERLGLERMTTKPKGALKVIDADPIFGFETAAAPTMSNWYPYRVKRGRSLLRIGAANGAQFDAAAITEWGGYVLAPFLLTTLEEFDSARWVVQPVRLLELALAITPMPIPDPTTAGGRRQLLVHVDGDGFASRAEIAGTPFASEVMAKDFIARYRIPHTISVIQGETAANGLYPQLASQLESIARQIFAMPHVELASHTYSHPFNWAQAYASTQSPSPNAPSTTPADKPQQSGEKPKYHLAIPGYTFDLNQEIAGSRNYIDTQLAPSGKTTKVLLWSGDCVPPVQALQAVSAAGLRNMNGGETKITNANPTWTSIAAMSLRKGGALQVFAPAQNENVYTNNWTGPFYGFERVIETFERTEKPYRFKPIDIYYHVYAASKRASIAALHKVYRWATAQPTTPIFASEYVDQVFDFEDFVVASDLLSDAGMRWRLVGDGALKTVRLPAAFGQSPDWATSPALAGEHRSTAGRYLHLGAPRTDLGFATDGSKPDPTAIWVLEANGQISDVDRADNHLQFHLRSHVAESVAIVHPKRCEVAINGQKIKGEQILSDESYLELSDVVRYRVASHVGGSTSAGALVSIACQQ
jgi:polysaccharide biosynthesis protein PelA